jgi:polysaccharide export outer membrane protein
VYPKQKRWVKTVVLTAAIASLSACSLLPNAGPNKRQIFSGSVQREGDAFVVEVNDRVTRATGVVEALGFSEAFRNASSLTADTIRPGDTLGLTIWENVDDGLLASEGANSTSLEEVQVDSAGFIFVPYAGRVRAAGNTPEALRGVITRRLEEQTPDPQVQVRRLAGDGATVTILGAGGTGVFEIERPTRTLASMLAASGGIAGEAEITRITVTRGHHSGTIWYNDLIENPQLDIALRGGDKIFIEADTRSFTALGATASQSRVPFESQNLSALEAIATVGGLDTFAADPTGVFVLRNESPEIAAQVLGRTDLQGPQRLIYVLNLTEPNGLFLARDFVIRDSDTLYVTEAPFTQWNKTISALTGGLTTVSSLSTLSE